MFSNQAVAWNQWRATVYVWLQRRVDRRVDGCRDAQRRGELRDTRRKAMALRGDRPAERSFSIDARISAGSASSARNCRATKSSGQLDALRLRDRDASRASPLRRSRAVPDRCGSRRAAGARDTSAPTAAFRNTNFSHSARRMSGDMLGIDARARRTRRRTPARARSRSDASNAPTRRRAIVPTCAITPGAVIVAAM